MVWIKSWKKSANCNMEIRTFKKSDLSDVLVLVKKIADHHHSLDPAYKAVKAYSDLEGIVSSWLDDPETQVFLAEETAGIVGYIRVGVESAPDYSAEKRMGMIYDSFVEEKYRRQGIAGQLFEAALSWLKKKKVNFVELNVDFRNESAIALWRKLGFREVKLRMRRPL
ncbi:MAG: GNAT family N-acetyltransferase [Parcubacteria group bacterium Gr01-1014_19]|nr:MAG: GNAT family N-acetyltransferase [Parcubacteria group bacterium Gr01-1014_19]